MDYTLNYTFDEAKKNWNIDIKGEIDIYNSTQLKEKLNSLIQDKPANLYINCINLDYIDSTGLGALVAVLKKAKQFNFNVTLSNLKPNVSKLFKITNLNKVFIIEGDTNE